MPRHRVGFLGPTVSHPISRLIWQGVVDQGIRDGFDVVLLSGGYIKDFSVRADEKAVSFTFAKEPLVEGLVVYGAAFAQHSTLEAISDFIGSFSVPVVNIGLDLSDCPCVVSDNREGLAQLVAHCVDAHGYRDVAVVTGPPDHQEARQRLETILTVLDDRGIRPRKGHILWGDFSVDSGAAAARSLLEAGTLPRVVLAADDDTALGVIQELVRHGVRVPEDVAVTGFDDSDLARLGSPGISTVRQDLVLQGREAASLLVRYLDGGPRTTVALPTFPVFRESCGCPLDPQGWMKDVLGSVGSGLGHSIESSHHFAELAVVNQDLNSIMDRELLAPEIRHALPTLNIDAAFLVESGGGAGRVVLCHGPDPGAGSPERFFEAVLAAPHPGRILVIEPLMFADQTLGYGLFLMAIEAAPLADHFAHDLANLIHRIEMLEDMRATEGRLRHSLEELNRTQRRLVESQRLAALGRLVAGVAHELNTPLGIAVTGFSFLKDTLKPYLEGLEGSPVLGPVRDSVGLVERNLLRAVDIIDRFRSVEVDSPPVAAESSDLGRLLGRLLDAQEKLLEEKGIRLVRNLQDGIQTRFGMSVLHRIVNELLNNAAVHAFGPGEPAAGGATVTVSLSHQGASLAFLEFRDNGRGVEPRRIQDIFVPFSGTRRTEGHVGLGLHMVHNLVVGALDGEVTCESDLEKGFAIRIRIPAEAPAASGSRP